jgi:hypothetical protein
VQIPYAVMQANATAVHFRYDQTTAFEFDCEWMTGPTRNRVHHQATLNTSATLNGAPASDPRKTGQYTGWDLIGWSGSGPATAALPTNADCRATCTDTIIKTIVPGTVDRTVSGELHALHDATAKDAVILTVLPVTVNVG